MIISEFPVHIHYHPHLTVDDYGGVKDLVRRRKDPFMVIMPEGAADAIPALQVVSDGGYIGRKTLQLWQEADRASNRHQLTDPSIRRNRAIGECVIDTKVQIGSIHRAASHIPPVIRSFNSRKAPASLEEAEVVLRAELELLPAYLECRDSYSASQLGPELWRIKASTPALKDRPTVPTLIEIGSMHRGLTARVASKGFPVTESVTPPDGATRAPSATRENHLLTLQGGLPTAESLQRQALENVVVQHIPQGGTTDSQLQIVNRILDEVPRKQWPEFYRQLRSGNYGIRLK